MATSRLTLLLLAAMTATVVARSEPVFRCQVFQTDQVDSLQWHPSPLPSSHFGFNFRVAAVSDAKIVLSESKHDGCDRIIITIGGNDNSRSSIARPQQSNGQSENTPNELKCEQFNEYWIQFNPSSVQVGRGHEKSPFLQLDLDSGNRINPKVLGFGTSVNSVGLFTFDDFQDHWVDPCSPNPCLNGGICDSSSGDGYRCDCPEEYIGEHCEERASNCPPGVEMAHCFVDPCQFAACAADPTATCVSNYCGGCNHEFQDSNGNPVDCSVDPCSEKPCNFGECIPGKGGAYRCECHEGYIGEHCDQKPSPKTRSGTCPPAPQGMMGICPEACSHDSDCPGETAKCCSNGCGHVCREPSNPVLSADSSFYEKWPACKPVLCDMYCGNGFDTDENGCEICACKACKPLTCRMACKNGFKKDENGCDICECEPPACKPLTCRMACKNGFKKDKDGCGICECEQTVCKPLACRMACEHGLKKDDDGCDICECEVPKTRPGVCPPAPEGMMGLCSEACSQDSDCPGETMKCCSNGCGHVCREPCSPVMCLLFCKNGFAQNENGCDICECKDEEEPEPKISCPLIKCSRRCDTYKKDERGCHTCQCEVPQDRSGECPKALDDMFGACSEDCRYDSDCADPMKCCSNGCGHTCVQPCSQVMCRLGCKNGFKRDERGCEMCACAEPRKLGPPEVEEESEEEEEEVFECGTEEVTIAKEVDTTQPQDFEIDKDEPSDVIFHSGGGQLIKVEVEKTSACIMSSSNVKLQTVELPKWCWQLHSLRLIVRFVTDGFNCFVRSGSDETSIMKYRKPDRGVFTCSTIGYRSKGKKRSKLRYRYKKRRGWGKKGKKGPKKPRNKKGKKPKQKSSTSSTSSRKNKNKPKNWPKVSSGLKPKKKPKQRSNTSSDSSRKNKNKPKNLPKVSSGLKPKKKPKQRSNTSSDSSRKNKNKPKNLPKVSSGLKPKKKPKQRSNTSSDSSRKNKNKPKNLPKVSSGLKPKKKPKQRSNTSSDSSRKNKNKPKNLPKVSSGLKPKKKPKQRSNTSSDSSRKNKNKPKNLPKVSSGLKPKKKPKQRSNTSSDSSRKNKNKPKNLPKVSSGLKPKKKPKQRSNTSSDSSRKNKNKPKNLPKVSSGLKPKKKPKQRSNTSSDSSRKNKNKPKNLPKVSSGLKPKKKPKQRSNTSSDSSRKNKNKPKNLPKVSSGLKPKKKPKQRSNTSSDSSRKNKNKPKNLPKVSSGLKPKKKPKQRSNTSSDSSRKNKNKPKNLPKVSSGLKPKKKPKQRSNTSSDSSRKNKNKPKNLPKVSSGLKPKKKPKQRSNTSSDSSRKNKNKPKNLPKVSSGLKPKKKPKQRSNTSSDSSRKNKNKPKNWPKVSSGLKPKKKPKQRSNTSSDSSRKNKNKPKNWPKVSSEESEEEEEEVFECGTEEVTIAKEVDTTQPQDFEIDKDEPSDVIFHSGGGQLIKVEVEKTSACIMSSSNVKLQTVELPKWCWQLHSLRLIVRFVTDGFNCFVRSGSDETSIMKYRKPDRGVFTCSSIGYRSNGKKRSKLRYRYKKRRGWGKKGTKPKQKSNTSSDSSQKNKNKPKNWPKVSSGLSPKKKPKQRSNTSSDSSRKNKNKPKNLPKVSSGLSPKKKPKQRSNTSSDSRKKAAKKLKTKGPKIRSGGFSLSPKKKPKQRSNTSSDTSRKNKDKSKNRPKVSRGKKAAKKLKTKGPKIRSGGFSSTSHNDRSQPKAKNPKKKPKEKDSGFKNHPKGKPQKIFRELEDEVFESILGRELIIAEDVDNNVAQEFEIERGEPADVILHSAGGQLIKIEIESRYIYILSSFGVKLKTAKLPSWCWSIQSLRLIVRFVTNGFNVFLRSSSGETQILEYRLPEKQVYVCGRIGFQAKGSKKLKLNYKHKGKGGKKKTSKRPKIQVDQTIETVVEETHHVSETIIETREEVESKRIVIEPDQYEEIEGIAGYETSMSFTFNPEDGITFRLAEKRGGSGKALQFVIESEWSYMQYNGQGLGDKFATRGGVLNSGKKSFLIKLPGSSGGEFWFELWFEGESSAYMRQMVTDTSFRPRYIDVAIHVMQVEEQTVEITYPNWIDVGAVTDQQFRFEVESAEVALIAIQANNPALGQLVAEFGSPSNPGCRIQKCKDLHATDCQTVRESSAACHLAAKRSIWAQLVDGEFCMGLVGDNKPIASYSGVSWLGDAGESKKLAIGTRGDGAWKMAG
ncbi:uncharacterized protein LOC119723228 [Patiria miniata]|uniref:Uncharacterized protein n=1 Tax=Patiria miniata TaxID=46514 RepID=A0A913ZE06_PATMI|nr:uncharacterized protein LOC119723228 [Patiria miniata]